MGLAAASDATLRRTMVSGEPPLLFVNHRTSCLPKGAKRLRVTGSASTARRRRTGKRRWYILNMLVASPLSRCVMSERCVALLPTV